MNRIVSLKMEKNESLWSKLSPLLTIVFGVIGIVGLIATVIEKKPDIEYKLLSEVNVLDINRPLQELRIFFMDEDIQEARKNLRIYTIRISNTGQVNILEPYFDSQQQWGLQFSGAEIVQTPRIVDTNSEYLQEYVSPMIFPNSVVGFNKVIFEKGKYFTVEVLVLQEIGTPTTIKVLGKIAGIDIAEVSPLMQIELSFWRKIFYGNWLTQLLRTIFFFLNFILIIAIIAWFSDAVDKFKLKKQQKLLAPFLEGLDECSRELTNHLAMKTECKLEDLKRILEEVTNVRSVEESIMRARAFFDKHDVRRQEDCSMHFLFSPSVPFEFVTKTGDGSVVIDESAVSILRDFIQFIENEQN